MHVSRPNVDRQLFWILIVDITALGFNNVTLLHAQSAAIAMRFLVVVALVLLEQNERPKGCSSIAVAGHSFTRNSNWSPLYMVVDHPHYWHLIKSDFRRPPRPALVSSALPSPRARLGHSSCFTKHRPSRIDWLVVTIAQVVSITAHHQSHFSWICSWHITFSEQHTGDAMCVGTQLLRSLVRSRSSWPEFCDWSFSRWMEFHQNVVR
jgi:hypothetical protein